MAPHTRTQPLAHPVPPSLYRLTRLLLPHYAPTTGKASAPQTLEDLVGLVVNQPAAAAALLTPFEMCSEWIRHEKPLRKPKSGWAFANDPEQYPLALSELDGI